MTKDDHINYWRDLAEEDWKIVLKLYDSSDFIYCLFFAHMVIEKISKALWVKNHSGNIPPKVHNIVYLLDDSKTVLKNESVDTLLLLNEFNIEARYPDYKKKIYQICTREYTDELLSKVKEVRKCLLNKLR